MRYARMGTRAAGEPLRFGVDSKPPSRERLAELLESCGLTLVEQRTLGQETDGQRAWGGFASGFSTIFLMLHCHINPITGGVCDYHHD
jgi:hypothetical protein